MVDALLIVAGLALLIAGAELLVRGASSIAGSFGVTPLVIGLTIVSFGTSLPELLVSFIAASQDKSDLAIANVLGSNIFNVLVVLGVAAMIRPLTVARSTVVSEIPFSLLAAVMVGFLANAALFSPTHELTISRLDGLILVFYFALFMVYVYHISTDGEDTDVTERSYTLTRAVLYIAVGVIGLYAGGEMTVNGASSLAASFGVSDAVIGLTIVAAGTSAPELTTSAVAAYRRQLDLAVGNVVGSNIFNLLWILGLTASVYELPFRTISNNDIVVVILSSSLIIAALIFSRSWTIGRLAGTIFVGLYVVHTAMTLYGRSP